MTGYINQTNNWQANGVGSTLDLHNLNSVTDGAIYGSHLEINSFAGGTINLTGVTSITDPNSGDQRQRSIDITADGTSSTVSLAGLTSFVDNYSGAGPNNDNWSSSITVSNGGAVQAGSLTLLQGVSLNIDAESTFAAANLAFDTIGAINVTGGAVSFAKLADVDGSSLSVSGSATLSLPAVNAFTNLSSIFNQTRVWQASGAGSLLDLHNLAFISDGGFYGTHLRVAALAGGTVNLAGTASITVPDFGDQRQASIDVMADGNSSTVNLAGLTSFVDNYAGGLQNTDNWSSSLTSQNGGALVVAGADSAAVLQGVISTVQTAGTIVGNLQLIQQSTLQGDGTIIGDLQNGGTVQPGTNSSAAILSVTGNYSQFADGALNINIGGATLGAQYDQLAIGGSAALAGTLNVNLTGGFIPALAAAFKVLTFTSLSADFQTYNGLSAGAGHVFQPFLNLADLTLATAAAAIRVTPKAGLVSSKQGDKTTFTVVLATNPTANVTIGISSSNPGEGLLGTGSPSVSLTFTPSNANVPQTVTVIGVNDGQAGQRVSN